MAVEQFTNGPTTTLDGAINDVVTSLTIDDATGFPAAAQYRIKIDSEIMIVTAGAGTTTWTVTRGAESTTAASHSDGATVTHILTAGAIDQFRADNVVADTFANLPTVGKEGRLFIQSDAAALTIARDTGAIWQPYGPIYKFKPPVLADFTWVNQGSATATQDTGILLSAPVTGSTSTTSCAILKKTAPSTPYTIRAAMKGLAAISGDTGSFGLCFRESSTGEIECHELSAMVSAQTRQRIGHRVTPTTNTLTTAGYLASTNWGPSSDVFWVAIEDNGTNKKFHVSDDGEHWITVVNVVRTQNMTPDEVGFYINPKFALAAGWLTGSADPYVRLLSWEEL